MAERAAEPADVILSATRALVGLAARSVAEVSDEVTLAQFRVMVLLDDGAKTMGEIADQLDVNPSTVTRLCAALAEKDLVSREALADNRRVVCADLTAAGRKLVASSMRRRRQLIDKALAPLPTAEQRRIASALQSLAEALGEVGDDAWTLGWRDHA